MGNFNSKTHPQPYDLPKGTIRITEKYHLTHFTLISQLGKGTFCKVMAVENLGSGRMQAMKYCFKERLLEKKAINHIIQERTLLENLNHPYICNLLYSFQDTNYVYMVLDLMTGGDLRAHVFQPIPEVWTTIFIYQEGCRIIMAEVCLALEYLHKNNIVHRDIKPDNILLDESGHAYLTDLNVAVNFQHGTPLKSVAGTEPYMAPELLVNNITGYYTSVDWWSLGVVLFEMIFADRPFRGKNKRDNIVKGEYRMPLSKFSHISGACRAFISDLLTVDVSVRMGAGLEGMKKFRTHPFFQARWTQRLPRTEREKAATALALAEASPQDSTADKPPPPKKLNVIKPISWNKVYKKKVKPEFHPCQKRIDILSKNKKLMGEKYAEAEKIKEAERTADMNEMLEIQAQGIVPTEPAAREYIALEEKYLEVREPKDKTMKRAASFVDLERDIKSCSSLLSLNAGSVASSTSGISPPMKQTASNDRLNRIADIDPGAISNRRGPSGPLGPGTF